MLLGMINEQGNCLDVRDHISEKNNIFDIFYLFICRSVASGALVLRIMGIATNKPMDLCYRCYI